jgi:hypothetical protein
VSVDSLLPADPDGLDLLHTREYAVQAWRVDDRRILLRGAVRDTKPPGLYIADDDEPLVIHHMVVDLTVDLATMDIEAVEVLFEMHPHDHCPTIIDHYDKIVGLSIARGFTHKVRELFGGPRGCTHTTALLQAMAPVAVQSTWSMRLANARRSAWAGEAPSPPTAEQMESAMALNLNTCHVWDEGGEQVARVRRGEFGEVPVWIRKRFDELGRDPAEWRMRG